MFPTGLSTVTVLVYITKVAKASLEKALEENGEIEGILGSQRLPIVAAEESPLDLEKPLIIKIDSSEVDHSK